MLDNASKMHIALLAALFSSLIAVLGALATYIDNYYTESVGQWVAHDLRMKTYHHLQRLSLGYYDQHQIGTLLSTITTDIQTIQGFASSSTLNILVDLLHHRRHARTDVLAELGLHPDRAGRDAVPAVLRLRFKKAVKKATKEVRKEQSEIVAVVQQGLESMQVVKAFGREDMEEDELHTVSAGDGRRRPEGAQGEIAALAGGDHHGRAVHGHRVVARRDR